MQNPKCDLIKCEDNKFVDDSIERMKACFVSLQIRLLIWRRKKRKGDTRLGQIRPVSPFLAVKKRSWTWILLGCFLSVFGLPESGDVAGNPVRPFVKQR